MNRRRQSTRARQLLAAAASAVVLALPAAANEETAGPATLAGQAVPARAQAETPMQKVGEARLKVLLWSVYDSRLYTPSGAYDDGDRPLRLEIQYLRDIRGQALVDRTLTEWEAMGRDHPRQDEWLQTLASLLPDIRSNDVLSLELDEQGIATFRHNGTVLGRVEDPEFGQQFVDIWLSRDCTRPELRLALLGRATGD